MMKKVFPALALASLTACAQAVSDVPPGPLVLGVAASVSPVESGDGDGGAADILLTVSDDRGPRWSLITAVGASRRPTRGAEIACWTRWQRPAPVPRPDEVCVEFSTEFSLERGEQSWRLRGSVSGLASGLEHVGEAGALRPTWGYGSALLEVDFPGGLGARVDGMELVLTQEKADALFSHARTCPAAGR